MKKVVYIWIAIFTFIIGTVTFYLFFSLENKEVKLVETDNSKINIPTARQSIHNPKVDSIYTLYEATQNDELNKTQKMHIRGYLMVRKLDSNKLKFYDLFDFNKDCLQGCLVEASLKLPQKVENDKKFSTLVNKLLYKGENLNLQDGFFYAEVEIIGKIERTNLCVVSPFYITIKEIKQVSSVKFLSKVELPEIIRRNNISQ